MATRRVRCTDGRTVALDDVGTGVPVLYFHGTPDSRLARHPEDDLATRAGARLLAFDRPGIGDSDPDPTATPWTVADDAILVLDELGIERAGVLAWSAGALFALALAVAHPARVGRVVLAAPLVPADAYADVGVLDGASDSRRSFASLLDDMTPEEIADELAGFLAIPGCDDATAREVLAPSLASVEPIAGAGEVLVAAFIASARQGLSGVARDLAAQATPFGDRLDAIEAPVSIHAGARDDVAPPAMARWLASRLDATLELHDADHSLPLHHWERLLGEATASV